MGSGIETRILIFKTLPSGIEQKGPGAVRHLNLWALSGVLPDFVRVMVASDRDA